MSDAGPSQPLNNATEGCSEGAGALLRFRGILQAVRHFLGLRAAPTTPGSESSPCDSGCIEGVPCLQWDVLHEIFPDYTDNVSQLQGRGSFNGEGPSDKVPHNNAGMELTVENINELITCFKQDVVQKKAPDGRTLIHHTIANEAFDAADVLFQYARKENLVVDLRWSNGDILEHSLAEDSRASVRFVMDKMVQRFANPKETAEVLSISLKGLFDRFPDVLKDFLTEDKFCFQYGTFLVPKHLFDNIDERPIAFVCSHEQADNFRWKAGTQEDTQRFWEVNRPDLAEKFRSKGEEEVTAVSKFFAIGDATGVGRRKFITNLTAANFSVDVFQCEAIKTNVRWKWHSALVRKSFICTFLHLLATLLFLSFATHFGKIAANKATWNTADVSRYSRARDLTIARISVSLSLLLAGVTLIILPPPYLWVSIVGLVTEGVLLVYSFTCGMPTNFPAFIVSVHCLIVLFESLQYLRSFRLFHRYSTMIVCVLVDVSPFLLMAAFMMITFGVSLVVLMGRYSQFWDTGESDTDDVADFRLSANKEVMQKSLNIAVEQYKRNFRSIWQCFEFLLYTIVANIEADAFHLSDGQYRSAWVIAFFYICMLLASIVLLSLLVSVLGDMFDKVMIMNAEAELTKHMAQRIAAYERMALWRRRIWSELGFFKKSASSFDAEQKYTYQEGTLKRAGSGLAVFHYLIPQRRAVARNKTEWQGRVHAVAQTAKDLVDQEVQKEKEAHQVLGTHIKSVQAKMITIDGKIDQRMGELEEKLESLQSRLDQVLQRLSNDLA